MHKNKPLLKALLGEENETPPIWMMRQAGRHLQEYRKVREQAGDFLTLCYTPKLAQEVTLQPIRRYNFDAAILFADILLVPDALKRGVTFKKGQGPLLKPLNSNETLEWEPETFNKHLSPVYETVDRLKTSLPKNVALIGFAGAPWTVATYMIAGKGTPDQECARKWIYEAPEALEKLIDILIETTTEYLRQQILAGAEVIKIFDSWAGSLPWNHFENLCKKPILKIIEALKKEFPNIPVIILAKGAGTHLIKFCPYETINCIAIDQQTCLDWACENIKPYKTIQGNLDPLVLEAGGSALDASLNIYMNTIKEQKKNFIFNLGHGIRQHTPPQNVEKVVNFVRNKS